MQLHYDNMWAFFNLTSDGAVMRFLDEQHAWLTQQATTHHSEFADPFWAAINLVLAQFQGMLEVRAIAKETEYGGHLCSRASFMMPSVWGAPDVHYSVLPERLKHVWWITTGYKYMELDMPFASLPSLSFLPHTHIHIHTNTTCTRSCAPAPAAGLQRAGS
jgi:hypothetical protein